MRTKDEIDRDIKINTKDLDLLIDEALQAEKVFEYRRKSLEKHIKNLKAEIPYEETPIGQIDKSVKETENKIKNLIDELEQVTGVTLKSVYEPNR